MSSDIAGRIFRNGELSTLKQRVLQAQLVMPNAKYLCIQGAHHNIGQSEYIAAIHTELLQYNKKD